MSPPTPENPPAPNSARRVLLASLAGTTIEFFDFYIYATAAVLVFTDERACWTRAAEHQAWGGVAGCGRVAG